MQTLPRYVCIHGHFYQPPRENPWLEAVELQDSAAPFHDWNDRISAECYAPNAAARILDEHERIARVVNNYQRMSFNFGPTLLSWLSEKAPRVYRAILQADEESQRRFSGHGSAMAQVYNHPILPLCNQRDKRTQVLWGLRDFKYRFGRLPEGMWLPETAVDLESLEVLAELGVRFTVLAPHQAKAVRRLGGRTSEPTTGVLGDGWQDVSGGRIDTTRAYQVKLPSGRTLAVLFYDGPIARAVAFERLLNRGEELIDRLLLGFGAASAEPTLAGLAPAARLVHIATDGETYGHHHKYGEMALAYALDTLDKRGGAASGGAGSNPGKSDVTLTNYGEFLARHPPAYEVEIFENTSWSCAHGISRWQSDCGCNSGGRPLWHQRWRAPLRQALDGLRDDLALFYAHEAAPLLRDPWAARDSAIDVVLDGSERSRARFLRAHAGVPLDAAAEVRVWKLLEMQRHTQLMYTSCGWFFDDIAGIETVQDLLYAGRALDLARELGAAPSLEANFLDRLEAAPGNTAEAPTGRTVYLRAVAKSRADLLRVGAHHAICSLLTPGGGAPPRQARVYGYNLQMPEAELGQPAVGALLQREQLQLGVFLLKVACETTREETTLACAVLKLSELDVRAGVLRDGNGVTLSALRDTLQPSFLGGDMPRLLNDFEQRFGENQYNLRHLFLDEQRQILEQSLAKGAMDRLLDRLEEHPDSPLYLAELLSVVELTGEAALETHRVVWKAQNACIELRDRVYAQSALRGASPRLSSKGAADWLRLFVRLGELLKVRLPEA